MTATESRAPWWVWPLLLVLLPLVAVGCVLWLAAAIVLQLIVWVTWCSRGRYALLVYSNSPIWQEYFEQHVLPAIGGRGEVLNWSSPLRGLAGSDSTVRSSRSSMAARTKLTTCGVNFSRRWTDWRH